MSNKKNKNEENSFENIDKLINNTFSRLKEIVDANTIIGSTIELPNKTFIIPISKVSVGIITGGGEMPDGRKDKLGITAGATTGFTLTPMGFITISDGLVNFISAGSPENNSIRLLDSLVGVCERVLEKREVDDEKM